MITLPITPGLIKLLEDIMPIAPGLSPKQVVGSRWPNGHWRRIRATYANGWDLIVNMDKKGDVSSCRGTTRMRTAAKVAA
jgi:hypothetical protein